MQIPKREYKKPKPFRDATLFIIVAEGEKEDKYFEFFNSLSQRVKIEIVNRIDNKSAPNFFIERIEAYKSEKGIGTNDRIWFVLDIDKWETSAIVELISYSNKKKNLTKLALSNPCFEVWLCYHFISEIEQGKLQNCKLLKRHLGELVNGGFNNLNHCKKIKTAISNSKAVSKDQGDYPTNKGTTHMYFLGEELIEFLGNSIFEV